MAGPAEERCSERNLKCGRGAGRDGGNGSVSMAVPQWDGVGPGGRVQVPLTTFVGIDLQEKPREIPPRQRVPERPRSGERTLHPKAGLGGVHAATEQGNAGLSDRGLSISEAGWNPERPVWTRKSNPYFFRKWVILKEFLPQIISAEDGHSF